MPFDDLMPDLLQEIPKAANYSLNEGAGISKRLSENNLSVSKKNKKPNSAPPHKMVDRGTDSFLKPPYTTTLSISLDSGLKNTLQNGLNQMLNVGDYRYGDLSDLIREAFSLYLQSALKPIPHPHAHKGRRVQMTLRLNERFKALLKERMPKKTRCILVDRILRGFCTEHMEYQPSSKALN